MDVRGRSPEYHDANLAFWRTRIVRHAADRLPILDLLREYTDEVVKAERDRQRGAVGGWRGEVWTDPDGRRWVPEGEALAVSRSLAASNDEIARLTTDRGAVDPYAEGEIELLNAQLRDAHERIAELEAMDERSQAIRDKAMDEVESLRRQVRGAVDAEREALIEDAIHEINMRWGEPLGDDMLPMDQKLVRETAEAIIGHALRGAVCPLDESDLDALRRAVSLSSSVNHIAGAWGAIDKLERALGGSADADVVDQPEVDHA